MQQAKKTNVSPSSSGHADGETAAHSWAADTGPGIISTAADNDPSGIVTYSLAGAQFGYEMLWACILSYPAIVALQLVSARIALMTGKGLTSNMREHYSRLWFFLAVGRFLIANTFNIGADVVAMGVGAHLLWHGSVPGYAAVFLAVSILLQWFIPYTRYAGVLKWLALSLFAYVAVAIAVNLQWTAVVTKALIPNISWSGHYFEMLLAVLGTTISPYLLYSQAEKEVETQHPAGNEKGRPASRGIPLKSWQRVCRTVLARTALSNCVAFSIIIAAAATLHTDRIASATPSFLAGALAPVAGGLAPQLLGLALISTALLALPPLAGSAAHAVASSFNWPDDRLHERRVAFTLVAITACGGMLGIALATMRIDPLRLLYWSAIVNGTTATPVMVLLVLLSTRHSCVGDLSAHWTLRMLIWLATAGMGAAVAARYVCEWLD